MPNKIVEVTKKPPLLFSFPAFFHQGFKGEICCESKYNPIVCTLAMP